MKYSYKWLKQFVDFDKNPQELADDLSCKSIEIENIEKFGGDFLENVVVGEIKEIKPHPNADKLKIAIVDVENARSLISRPSTERELEDDNTSRVLQIVCGAPNIEAGQKVPVALVGCRLPMGEIKQAKIRDIESFGMLCAEDELGLGADHSGIMILDKDLKIGTKLSEIYSDWVLEGKVLANRGDLQNHAGLALEISAVYNQGIKEEPELIEDSVNEVENVLEVKNEVENTYYSARMIKNIKLGPSPIWMRQSLLACGMRPINNVVDITNYVMLKYGNPMHAFDATKLKIKNQKSKIVVRLSKKDEIIRTLDGKDYELGEGLLVIADEKKPIAVAGVMGGENSEISDDTTDIILESAVFDQKLIRKSQRELGMRTEASSRFEKGLSTYLAKVCLDEASRLYVDVCGGELVPGKVASGEIKENFPRIICNINKIKAFLSIDINEKKIAEILDGLGIEHEISGEILFCYSPQWRKDIAIWQDIAEEIGRIYGLDNTKEEELMVSIEPKTKAEIYFEQTAKKFLSESGLIDIFSLSIISYGLTRKTGFEKYFFEITNPLNEDDFIMRSSLIPGLLNYASENAKKSDKFGFFDISKVYLPSTDVEIPSHEQKNLAILIYGESDSRGFYIAKEHLEVFGRAYDLEFTFENTKENKIKGAIPYCHPGRCADILYKNEKVGEIFEVHPGVLKNMDLKRRVWALEISTEELAENAQNINLKFQEEPSEVIFKEFSRFEVSKRDMAIVLDSDIDGEKISLEILEIDDRIISAELFDEYASDKLGKGKKSLAFHLVFQAKDHTLTDEEADEIFNKILDALNKEHKAELRR